MNFILQHILLVKDNTILMGQLQVLKETHFRNEKQHGESLSLTSGVQLVNPYCVIWHDKHLIVQNLTWSLLGSLHTV